jgi:hypothetical protein
VELIRGLVGRLVGRLVCGLPRAERPYCEYGGNFVGRQVGAGVGGFVGH